MQRICLSGKGEWKEGGFVLGKGGKGDIPRPLNQNLLYSPFTQHFQSAISEESNPHTPSPNPPYSSKQGDGFSLKRGEGKGGLLGRGR